MWSHRADNIEEMINILYREELSLDLYNGMAKYNRDVQVITEDVINKRMDS